VPLPTSNFSRKPTIAVIDDEGFGYADRLSLSLDDEAIVCDAMEAGARADRVRDADILVTEEWLPDFDVSSWLKFVQIVSAGYEHLDPTLLKTAPWTLAHAGGAAAVPVAEWCIGMMRYFSRRFGDILAHQQTRSWYTSRMKEMTSRTLRGQVVGIVGYGAIGREVARMCHALGMRIHASRGRSGAKQSLMYISPGTGDPDGMLPEQWFALADLPSAVEQFDFIVLGLRDTDQTRDVIERSVLSRCKPGCVLINPSRVAGG
jgi:phosphoglycerate dehydrogenase-like enzyme